MPHVTSVNLLTSSLAGAYASPLLEMPSLTEPEPLPGTKVIALGDVHGASLEELIEDLHAAGLVDPDGHWAGEPGFVFVQMGDVVDRGARSREDYNYFRRLQTEAPEQVVRLLGNHEFFHLIGLPHEISAGRIPGLQEDLIKDVLEGRILLAWPQRDILYSHAGIDLDFLPEFRGLSVVRIAEMLNAQLQEAVRSYAEDLAQARAWHLATGPLGQVLIDSYKIFDTDRGILWTREDIQNDEFRQVVGHTPQARIIAEPGLRVKYIDAGRIFAERGHPGFERRHGRAMMGCTENGPELRRKIQKI